MQHDETTGAPLLDKDGHMLERPKYLIAGVNCTPYSWARDCWRDARKYRKNILPNEVKTHQYIISFAPEDIEKGLTLKEAEQYGMQIAKAKFRGHRALVCAHPDGAQGSGNIHVHIVICSIRFEDRPPETYMRTGKTGKVKQSEYKAGCKHWDTARLRHAINKEIQAYCKERGYAYLDENHKAARKKSKKEKRVEQYGQEQLDRTNAKRAEQGLPVIQDTFMTQQDELRHAIDEALVVCSNATEMCTYLKNHFTRTIEMKDLSGKRRFEKKKIEFEMKYARGRISYKHPDAKGWVRGSTLGAAYDEKAVWRIVKSSATTYQKRTQTENASQGICEDVDSFF